MNVANLKPDMKNVNVTVKVVRIQEEREVTSRKDGRTHRLVEALVGDETGTVVLSLWDERADQVKEGDVLRIENGYTTVIRGHLRLNVGKYGKMEHVDEEVTPNEGNNVSDKEYPRPRRFDFPRGGRSFGRRF